jgi:hypothetical protein
MQFCHFSFFIFLFSFFFFCLVIVQLPLLTNKHFQSPNARLPACSLAPSVKRLELIGASRRDESMIIFQMSHNRLHDRSSTRSLSVEECR